MRRFVRLRGLITCCFAAVALSACASGGILGSDRAGTDPSAHEQAMLSDGSDGALDHTSRIEAALIVGGTRNADQLAQEVGALDTWLRTFAHDVDARAAAEGLDKKARAKLLLGALYQPHAGQTMLQRYDNDATALYDVITTGRYNCVSATMLYLLAASRLGIDARPVLLPSHARAVVVTDGERWIVETTSPFGFDPPKELLAKARDRSRPKTEKVLDLYADEKGTEVDFAALLAVTYGNIAIAAQESGETALASSLLARESALTPPSLRAAVRMQQASMLTQRAIKKSEDGQYEEALTLARHAFALADKDEDKQRLEQNLAVLAGRRLHATEAKMDDAELGRFASTLREFPNAYGDVEAEVLTILARRKRQRGDVNGSAADLRGAAVSASSNELRALADRNAFSGELIRLGVLSESDPEGAWSGFGHLAPPSDAELAARYQKVRSVIATNRAIQLSNAGSCESLEQLFGETPEIPHGAALRGACRSRFGLMLARKGEFEAAARELRNARTYEPNEKRHVRNLVTVLEKYEDALVRNSQCDAARNVAAEGTMIAPEEPYFGKIAQSCVSRPTPRTIVLRMQ